MTARNAVALAVLAAFGGCLHEDAGGQSWRFGGVFEAEATQADFDDFARRMAAYGGDAVFMESHPVEFMVRGLAPEDCPTAEDEAAGLTYVRSVSQCMAQAAGAAPDSPTGDGS